MRLIGTLPTQDDAENLSAWMTVEGMANHVDLVDGKFEIWIKEEDHVAVARDALRAFLNNPKDAKFADARRRVAILERERQLKQRRHAQNVYTMDQVRGEQARTPLVFALIAIAVAVGLFTSFGNSLHSVWFRSLSFVHLRPNDLTQVVESQLESAESLKFWSLRRGELWRLITPIFIHFGTVHLIFNLLWLWQLGRAFEQRFGSWWLLLLVLAAAALGNLAEVAVPSSWGGMRVVTDHGHGVLNFGGMSGVVYSLFGFLWVRSVIDPSQRQLQLSSGTIAIMLGWLLFCSLPISEEILGSKTANWAHGLGLAVGIAAAFLGYWLRRPFQQSS